MMNRPHVIPCIGKSLASLVLSILLVGSALPVFSAPASKKPATTKAIKSFQSVDPLNLVRSPDSWLGQNVSFDGVFNNFDAYALDYKPAFRDPKDFVCVIIRRPDTPAHPIPLSELKMVFPRSKSKTIRDLEPGDKIALQGKVFSAALGDPWLELSDVKLLEKTPNSKLKDKDKKAAH